MKNKVLKINLIFMIIIFVFSFLFMFSNIKANDEEILKEEDKITILPGTTVREVIETMGLNDGEYSITDFEGKHLDDNSIVGTGARIFGDSSNYILIAIGDTTGDGIITLTDLAQIKAEYAAMNMLSGVNKEAADVNRDGATTIEDINIIKKALIGQEEIQLGEIRVKKLEGKIVDNELAVGENVQAETQIKPFNASNKVLNWSSSNSEIAAVDNKGNITGISNGTATITATTTDGSNLRISFNINIQTYVNFVQLNTNSLTVDLSGTKTGDLIARINPSTASDKTIEWISSNTSIATVNSTGKVTGIKNGTCEITAKAGDGKTAKCSVTVQTSATGITLSKSSLALDLSGTKTGNLTATITPSTASYKTTEWTTSDKNIATVDSTGKVTGVKNGTCEITAKTRNGKIAKCSVTVQTSATGITISKSSLALDLSGTKNSTLIATVVPSTASDKTIEWVSSNTSIATVDNAGKVTGVKNGTCEITAKTKNGKTAKCSITIQTSPTGITLNKTSINLTGKTGTLTATVVPNTATDKTVTWSSNKTAVATIKNGTITAVAPGTATITAKTSNGKTVNCTVYVTTNILFIGNSKTYYNRMPEKIFTPIAEKAGKRIYVESVVSGGKTLKWHYDNRKSSANLTTYGNTYTPKSLVKTLSERRWDYVVLQEQTATSYEDYEKLKTGASSIVSLMKNSGSPNVKIIYNAIWMNITSVRNESSSVAEMKTTVATKTGAGTTYSNQKKANDNYRKLKAESGMNGKIAFSGKAFIWCWRDEAGYKIQLYKSSIPDWNHPSVWGSYLEACCIYSAIFGVPSNDIIIDKAWSYCPGKVDEAYSITSSSQKTLWKIVRQVQ